MAILGNPYIKSNRQALLRTDGRTDVILHLEGGGALGMKNYKNFLFA
jgi:hypothetical protein